MKSKEKTAVVRIFVDLIKADGIIDAGELEFYDAMRKKYGFTQENEVEAMSTSFSDAISVLRESERKLREDVLSDCKDVTVSDGFCAHSEALLLIALKWALDDDESENASVISIPEKSLGVDHSTVLYLESKYDVETNQQIVDNYRSIYKEFLFSGLHFVYIPNVIHHYKKTNRGKFCRMIHFLAPSLSSDCVDGIVDRLLAMTTESFCNDILYNRLNLENLREANPSLLIKIGNNYVGDVEYSNLLCVEIWSGFMDCVKKFVDEFSSMPTSDTLTVPTGREANNQYLYYGFYKQLLDIFLRRNNIRSRIVIDPNREEIFLPDIGQKLCGLSRRDKAMYVLFLILMKNNGFSFNCPSSMIQMNMYNKKIIKLQKQYAMVYGFMGGNQNMVPDISSAEIRRPIFSRIKRSLMSMQGMLYNLNDYLIAKNSYGTYNVNVKPEMIYISDWKTGTLLLLAESDIMQKVVRV